MPETLEYEYGESCDPTSAQGELPPDKLMVTESTHSTATPDEFRQGSELGTIMARIAALWSPEDSDDVIPTPETLKRTVELLQSTAYQLQHKAPFPAGHVSSMEDGEIRIEWWKGRGHCVTLVVHDQLEKSYVFVKLDGGEGILEQRLLPARLASRLDELNQVPAE